MMTDVLTKRPIGHEEARQIAQRLINSAFRNSDKECARFGIPARPDYDDDLLISAYIRQQERALPTPLAPDAVTENAVCHDEQLRVWAQDVMGALGLNDFLPENMDYDTGLRLERIVMREIKNIVGMAFRHPALATPNAVTAALSQTPTTQLHTTPIPATGGTVGGSDHPTPDAIAEAEWRGMERAARVCRDRNADHRARADRAVGNAHRESLVSAIEAAECVVAIRAAAVRL